MRLHFLNSLIFLLDALRLELAVVLSFTVSLQKEVTLELFLLLSVKAIEGGPHPLCLHSSLGRQGNYLSLGDEFLLPGQRLVFFEQVHLDVQFLGSFLLFRVERLFLNFLRGKFALVFFPSFQKPFRVLLLRDQLGSSELSFSVFAVLVFLLSVLLGTLLSLVLFERPAVLGLEEFFQELLLTLAMQLRNEVLFDVCLRGRSKLEILGRSGVVLDDFGLLFHLAKELLLGLGVHFLRPAFRAF